MSLHTDVVPYRWTNLDRLASSPWVPLPNLTLTPYRIPISAVPHASERDKGEQVHISLGLSNDPSTVARFFREGYEWVDVPDEVEPGDNLGALFSALFEHDPRRFAHFDPALNIATAAADVAARLPEMGPTDILDPEALAFGDLALLHFEYWGNTDLRAAIINERSTSFEIPLLEIDPLSTLMTSLIPLAIPTSFEGHAIRKVLARRPMRGVPIRAVSTTEEERNGKLTTVVSLPPPRIELDGFDRRALRALRYREWVPRASKVRFRVTLAVPASEVRIEILKGGAVYYEEKHTFGEFVVPGVHLWSWDGYDSDGVLDTTLLRQNDLSARLVVTDLQGRNSVATTDLGTGSDVIRWVDAKIVPALRRIEVTVACRFTQPSAVELASFQLPVGPLAGFLSSFMGGLSSLAAPGRFPGSSLLGMVPGVSKLPTNLSIPYPGLPDGSSIPEALNTGEVEVAVNFPPVLDLDEERFARLQTAVMAGISRHWSRTVTIEGEPWTVDVKTQLRQSTDAQWTILCRSVPEAFDVVTAVGTRSFNLATFMEGLPIVNIWNDKDDEEGDVTDIDAGRAETGAHELGHSVLRESHSFYWSLIHKGTSTVGQDRLPSAPNFSDYMPGEEMDLMHYRHGSRPSDWQERIMATEEDVLGLVAMAAVSFG